jgi:hypothetical protein
VTVGSAKQVEKAVLAGMQQEFSLAALMIRVNQHRRRICVPVVILRVSQNTYLLGDRNIPEFSISNRLIRERKCHQLVG